MQTQTSTFKTLPAVGEKVEKIHRVNLKSFVERQNGRFVSVTFTKASGETRILTGRLGVKRFLVGGSNKVERQDRPYLTMFDVNLLGYRATSLATLTQIRAGKQVFDVVD